MRRIVLFSTIWLVIALILLPGGTASWKESLSIGGNVWTGSWIEEDPSLDTADEEEEVCEEGDLESEKEEHHVEVELDKTDANQEIEKDNSYNDGESSEGSDETEGSDKKDVKEECVLSDDEKEAEEGTSPMDPDLASSISPPEEEYE